MHHLFLSPHPDDAVLSCGGLIDQLVRAGERVTIVTVMGGPLPADVPISPFIAEHLRRWGVGADPMPGRQAEDRCAAAVLGAQVTWLPFPDALYRTDGQGQALYRDRQALFGAVHPRDPLAGHPAIVAACAGADIVYAPLGAGQHVDHQIVAQAIGAASLPPQVALFLYEEYPYSADGAAVIATARAAWPWPVRAELRALDEVALAAKVRAIACYASQISTFWDDVASMAQAVRAYALQVGDGTPAERLWRRA